ncbi:MAG: imidazolonepropionase [Candidatus Eremiobacteraeota bacterium]|nr:imidazolonepropionase [Candidatus Eremiobacteraeota bacterium]
MVSRPSSASYAIVNATLLTMAPLSARATGDARVGEDDLGIVRDATIVVRDGVIAEIGGADTESSRSSLSKLEVHDARDAVVMPGLVDAHTHALFAGDRVADFEALAQGAKPRLGIAYTVEQTRQLDRRALVALGRERLAAMLLHGTTTVEIKSGYALTADGEVTLVRALADLDAASDLPHVIATFCGAHALPPEFASYDAFGDELVERILPAVAALGIARFADAFCERGYFSVEQSRRFLAACKARGMQLRIHADELAPSGGAQLAAQLGCVSADHLNFADDADVRALRAAGSIAVLCPATAQYLGLERFAPARALIEGGVPVALATDFNPGTCPCFSLQEVAHIARRRLRMSAAETIAAVTTIAARSLESNAVAGCIAANRPADIVILNTSDYREFGYYFGVNLVRWASPGARAGV